MKEREVPDSRLMLLYALKKLSGLLRTGCAEMAGRGRM